MYSRRVFLETVGAAVGTALAATRGRAQPAATHRADHPDPRPGIDGARVLTPEQLADYPDVIDVYDGIRRIPQIADGIRCQCGCSESEGMRSLLTCFESNGMARHCEVCQSQGRLAVRWHDAGRSLDEIRAAIDARFGTRSPHHHSL